MQIVIAGGGSLGRIFGSFLGSAGHSITLVDIDRDVVEAATSEGIGFFHPSSEDIDEFTTTPVKAVSNASSIESADLVLLMVKSNSTESGAKAVQHLVGDHCPLLSIQAGLGNLEVLQEIVSPQHILLGTTMLSGTALSGARVRLGSTGLTKIGEPSGEISPRLVQLADLLSKAGLKTETSENIMTILWEKVLIFSAINPVAAILKIRNGCLMEREESIALMQKLLEEGIKVAGSCNIVLYQQKLFDLLSQTCLESAENLAPMLQDIFNNRTTEIDAQNGIIVELGLKNQISVPTHQAMVQLIKLLECWQQDIK